MSYPRCSMTSTIALALAITCFWYSLNSGCIASLKQTALAAIMCSKGPPCIPGNTAAFNFFSNSGLALASISPLRGPRKVL